MGELEQLQARAEAIEAELEQSDGLSYPPSWPCYLGKVYAVVTIPTTANVFVATHPCDVLGTESEGATATIGVNTAITLYAYIVGVAAAVDDLVVGYWMGNRWAAERWGTGRGTTTVSIPGCPCTFSPECIGMTVTDPSGNNNIFQNAILKYGPTPSVLLPVVLTASSYLSTTTFFDPILNVPFFYFLTCTINSYVLTRVYATSPFGSPFRDSVRYKWVPGFPGNDCGPPSTPVFKMESGQIFLGGDPVRGHTELHGVASPC